MKTFYSSKFGNYSLTFLISKRLMGSLLFSALFLAASYATGAEESVKTPQTELKRADNKNLANAKALVDKVVATLQADPNGSWEKHSKKLGTLIEEADLDEFTKDEMKELDAYSKEKGKKVKPILDRLDVEARKINNSKPAKKDFLSRSTCFTSCIGFIQWECGTNRIFGVCVGEWWDCEDGLGGHQCLTEAGGDVGKPDSCKSKSDCPPGFNCATWTFKANECLQECEKDSDCPGALQCKKPLGTSWKRCK